MTAPNTPDFAALDRAVIAAHQAEDWVALIRLYAEAADRAETAGDIDAACFFLTQAYVFALQEADPLAETLHARLEARGREE